MVYFGLAAPKVKKEIVYRKNEEIHKQVVAVDVKKIIPCFIILHDTKVLYIELKIRKNIIWCYHIVKFV